MMRVLHEMAGGSDTTTTTTPTPLVSGWTGDVWLGSSSYPGVSGDDWVICAHGNATWTGEYPEGGYMFLTWSAPTGESFIPNHRVDIEITGPLGARKQFTHSGHPSPYGGAEYHWLSVGPQSWTAINAGEATETYVSEGSWALFVIPSERVWVPSSKNLQQWAGSIDCTRG